MRTRIFSFLFCCLVSISPAKSQTVSTILSNGDPANRIDIAFLSEGYTSSESAKFTSDVNTFINAIFNSGEIYVDYKTYFNVRTLFVASAESGATHQELTPPVIKNTAFDAYYGCEGIARLICVDTTKVNAAVSSALPANQRDYVFVLVNDSTYGGSGGSVLVSSTNSQAVETILHEFGHTHGLLADEYTTNPPPCDLAEPSAANATTQTARDQIKWELWIGASTPIPTTTATPGVPGLYEGADYCATGMYRPTFNSKMRTLGKPYEQVNDEQMVRRLYNLVSALDSTTPLGTSLSAPQGTKPSFSVTPLQPVQHSLSVSWYVDGLLVASGTSFVLETSTLSLASHSVKAVVQDNTNWVRSDPNNLTMDSQTWTVLITPGITSPKKRLVQVTSD
ncbi:MAG: M64 family metallopeptidase [Acidobacteriia bacterium]|nr:M64 family metallopeptidase [Terriglobia bacterium]